MPVTLNDAIFRIRSNINEPAYPTLPTSTAVNGPFPQFYTDTELTSWINGGLRDISRRAEDLLTFDTSISIPAYVPVAGQSAPTYPLQTDIIRIQRIEFVPTGAVNQVYPLVASNQQQMDQVWGTYQQNPASYPQFWVTRGYPEGTGRNSFQLQVYPVPSQGGTLNIIYYRLPTTINDPVADNTQYQVTLDIVEGWSDLAVEYATYKALQKARVDEWKDRRDEYNDKVEQMINVTRYFTDQPSYFSFGTRFMPSWLTEWDS